MAIVSEKLVEEQRPDVVGDRPVVWHAPACARGDSGLTVAVAAHCRIGAERLRQPPSGRLGAIAAVSEVASEHCGSFLLSLEEGGPPVVATCVLIDPVNDVVDLRVDGARHVENILTRFRSGSLD